MNQQCKVCGEPAAGFHFGAFTCEGCKSFFGRTYNNLGSISECKNNSECVINKKNRTACKACRLRKCLLVGMSKSGSRYGRRSNWFKIHCLLQEQQQQQASQHPGMMAAGLLRPHPYLPLFRNPIPTQVDSKSSESDSGASSADPEDDLRSASALACRPVASPFSDRGGDFFSQNHHHHHHHHHSHHNHHNHHNHTKKLPSPSSDNECFARRKLSASITLALPASPASLPSVSPGGGAALPGLPSVPGNGTGNRWLIPPFHALPDPSSWRDLWLKGPAIADQPEPTNQEQPIDLSVKSSMERNSTTTPPPSAHSEGSEHELSIDVGVEDSIKTVPLDLSLEAKRAPDLTLTG